MNDDLSVEIDEDEVILPGEAPEGTDEEEMVEVELDDTPDEEANPAFYANLAEDLPEHDLARMASELWDKVEKDREARMARVDSYARALERLGLDGKGKAGADFEGSSIVTHPMMIEACVDFAARAIKELWPVGGQDGGPVKVQTIGEATKRKGDKAKRKSRHMNWQMTKQMRGFRPNLKQVLSQVPMAGVQYMKLFWDRKRGRPSQKFVPMDEVYLPYDATSFWDADRLTHRITLTGFRFDEMVQEGVYRDPGKIPASEPDETAAASAAAVIEGKTRTDNGEDGTRDIYEVYCYWEVEGDNVTGGDMAPYIVTLDQDGRSILSIYRNWDEHDPDREEIKYIVEWGFLQWRGAQPIGLPHLIGGLNVAAEGALRALLDAAHLNNMPGLLKLKGGWKGGQDVKVDPTSITELDGSTGVDDVRKLVMPIPFNQPSPVLFELLGFLSTAGKGVVQTAFEELSEQKSTQPVGTTLALIEQGMVVFSDIHASLHQSMERTLEILHTLNRIHLKDTETRRETGEVLAKREDYEGPLDVVPVSDPNIFSEAQRMAQMQMVAQRAALMPMLYNLRDVEKMILERTKIPGAEKLLIPEPKPQRMNPVNENVSCALGQPIVAFPDQNHEAHLVAHLAFAVDQMFGSNPSIAPVFMPAMLEHIKQHIIYWYVDVTVELGTQIAGVSVAELMDDDPIVGSHFDDLMSEVSARVLKRAPEVFQQLRLPELLAQMQAVAQQYQLPQPMDPEQAKMQVAASQVEKAKIEAQGKQVEVQAKTAEQQGKGQEIQIKQAEMALKGQDIQLKREELQGRLRVDETERMEETRLAELQLGSKEKQHVMKLKSDELRNTADNLTALTIAQAEIKSGEKTALKSGTGINP